MPFKPIFSRCAVGWQNAGKETIEMGGKDTPAPRGKSGEVEYNFVSGEGVGLHWDAEGLWELVIRLLV